MLNALHCSRVEYEDIQHFLTDVVVIQICDPFNTFAENKDEGKIKAKLQLKFSNIDEEMPDWVAPNKYHAKEILQFIQDWSDLAIVIQTESGIGLGSAIVGAVDKIYNYNVYPGLKQGTHNILLYNLLLKEAGIKVPPEPLVSMVVGQGYPLDRLQLFLLSMKRQRHKNWECIVVPNGLNPKLRDMLTVWNEPRVRLLHTPADVGFWGHPWRQAGLDAAKGEFIGMSNDDNYYVPGYFDQMIQALEDHSADLALCYQVHAYSGWGLCATEAKKGSTDLGCWIARASLVRQVKWPGNKFNDDGEFVEQMAKLGQAHIVHKPLFVKN